MKDWSKAIFGKDVRLGQNVVITETVTLGEQTSIWHNVVLRGDVSKIVIGKRCNIQDNTVLHGQLNQWDVLIGDDVSIGHSCILHGCQLENQSFVGMGSILMNGSFIGPRVMVAAGTLVSQGSRFEEPNKLVMGRPGKVVRDLRDNEIEMILDTPKRYLKYALKWLPNLNQEHNGT